MAPKAKTKNQRDRRLRNSMDNQHVDQFMKHRLKITQEQVDFKSNSISPGTQFMLELASHIDFFLKRKIHEDFEWKNLKVIFSSGSVPGEGEQKIMDFIRSKGPSLNPRDMHCIYSNDSDLIMLGLKLHLPNLFILRESNVWVDKDRQTNYAAKRFSQPVKMEVIFINLLREYLYLEFMDPKLLKDFKKEFKGEWGDFGSDAQKNRRIGNVERFIDDFVLLTCFVGNDFLPALYGLSTKYGHLDLLIRELKSFYASEGLFLVFREEILFKNLLLLLKRLSKFQNRLIKDCLGIFEREINNYDRRKKMLKGSQKSHKEEGVMTAQETEYDCDLFLLRYKNDYKQMIRAKHKLRRMNELKADPEEARLFYYLNYFREGVEVRNRAQCDQVVRKMCRTYFEGMEFKHRYYTIGCPSWTWLYDFELCPLLPDLVAFLEEHLEKCADNRPFPLELGQPFRPFIQLLHILPKRSFNLLPETFEKTLFKEHNEPAPAECSEEKVDHSSFYFKGEEPEKKDLKNQGSLKRLQRSYLKNYSVVAIDNTRNYTWHPLVEPLRIEDMQKLIHSVDWASLTPDEKRRNAFGVTKLFKFDASASLAVESTLPGFETVSAKVQTEDFDFETIYGKHVRKIDKNYVTMEKMLGLSRFRSPSFLRRFGGFANLKLARTVKKKRDVMFLEVKAKILRDLLVNGEIEERVDKHLDDVDMSRKALKPQKESLISKSILHCLRA